MNKIIKVYDNLVPDVISDQILNLTIGEFSKFPWNYQHNLTKPPKDPNFIFDPGLSHSAFGKENILSPYYFILSQPLYYFCIKENFVLDSIKRVIAYLNLPNPNPSTFMPPHTDRRESHWVCLYYINDSEGDTVLFEDDEVTEIKRVTPKKGRMIIFDGSIKHTGSTPRKSSRAIINMNFLGKKLDKG